MTGQASIDALFAAASRKHLDGDLAAAEAFYREILLAEPGNARAMHYLGFLLLQTDRLPEALGPLAAAVVLEGGHAEWHFNLGIALSRLGRAADAIDAFGDAIVIDPRRYFYWTNLGACFESTGEWERAEHCYKTAAEIDPACPDAFFLLSALYLKLERFDEARRFNYRGIAAAPAGSQSRIMQGQAYHELGRTQDAIALFEAWLAEEPGNPVAAHLLAAYRGRQAPERCSGPYVETTFDAFADNFEHTLGRLKYCGPQLVHDHLAALNPPPASLDVLDLGCGTGLVGEVLHQHARRLTGVDLSQAMLDRAAAKRLYHRLYKADIADFLRTGGERYDLVACMDTFIYLGRLDEVLASIARQLESGGLLLFSTEKLTGARGYRLNVSGRYSHHPDYLREALGGAGFVVGQMRDVAIRMEAGCPIEGQFVCARRSGKT